MQNQTMTEMLLALGEEIDKHTYWAERWERQPDCKRSAAKAEHHRKLAQAARDTMHSTAQLLDS